MTHMEYLGHAVAPASRSSPNTVVCRKSLCFKYSPNFGLRVLPPCARPDVCDSVEHVGFASSFDGVTRRVLLSAPYLSDAVRRPGVPVGLSMNQSFHSTCVRGRKVQISE